MAVVPFLLRYPYVFHLAFIALFASPLNNGAPFKVIPLRAMWRTILYLTGIVMGAAYTVGFLAYVVSGAFSGGPFGQCEGATDNLRWYFNQYVLSTGFPVGAAMMLFHVSFMQIRMGAREGAGCSLGNAQVIIACALVQFLYISIWATFAYEVTTACGGFGGALAAGPLTICCTAFGTSCILLVMLVRAVVAFKVFAVDGGDCQGFQKAYCGCGSVAFDGLSSSLTWDE